MASRKQRNWNVPGFGLSLRWPELKHPTMHDENTLLASALDCSEDPKYCYTSRETTIIAWINELTDLSNWERKIFDPDFTFEWKSAKILTGNDVTRAMVDWCVEEVKFNVHDFLQNGIIPAIDGGILKSDALVDHRLQMQLSSALAESQLDPAAQRRSSSGVRTAEMVDPFLYPYQWELSRTLRGGSVSLKDNLARCGEGEVVKAPPAEQCAEREYNNYRNEKAFSNRFQWLPFDVEFVKDAARISSYINNVHPTRCLQLYDATEILINALIPAFNKVVLDLKAPGYQNQRVHLVDYSSEDFIFRDPRGPFRPPEQRAYPEYLNKDGLFDKSMFVDLKQEYWNIGLQFVLHVREIKLTREESEYAGEEWHVQGQNNERIVASATYIAYLGNITPATISFRRRINTEEAIAAKGSIHAPPFLPQIFNARHGDPAVQTLGSIALRPGRVVMWPNTFQSRLEPFRLQDTKHKGSLMMFTLHLIDPNRRMMSTAHVPCQRQDWWEQEVARVWPRLGRLPRELRQKIFANVDFPIGTEEAEKSRHEFVEEREEFRKLHTRALEGYEEWDFWGEPAVHGDDD